MTAPSSNPAGQSDVDPDHLNRIVALANKLGRKPGSNAVIRELKSAGIGIGRTTARKLLDRLDQTELEDHRTGPRLRAVRIDETTRTTDTDRADPNLSGAPDHLVEPSRSTPVRDSGTTPDHPPEPTGPVAETTPGPDRSDYLSDQPEPTGSASRDEMDQYPTIDPDRVPDQQWTTGPGRTEPNGTTADPLGPPPPVQAPDQGSVARTETTGSAVDPTPDLPARSTRTAQTETALVRRTDAPVQDPDRGLETAGPRVDRQPSAKAEKLLAAADQAAELRAYQTDPAVIALRAERIRLWTGRLVWTGLVLGLLFTAGNVQQFAAQGAEAWSTPWLIAWVLDPMVSLVLVGLLLAESVTSRYQVKAGRWMRSAKWFALFATYAMNTWQAWKAGDPAGILLHSIPPGIVFFAAEAITDAWDKITEAVNVAVGHTTRDAGEQR